MKIYILDDEYYTGGYEKRDQLASVLAGHELTVATSLDEGKSKFSPLYDLMLLDFDMNGNYGPVDGPNTGLEFVKWMVKQPYNVCPRVEARVFCNECGYSRSEARYCEDRDQEGIPHKSSPLPQIIIHSVSKKGREAMSEVLDNYGYHHIQFPFSQKYVEFLKASFSLERKSA